MVVVSTGGTGRRVRTWGGSAGWLEEWSGVGEVVALPVGDPEVDQADQLVGRFDPFGDDLGVTGSGEGEEGSDHGLAVVVGVDAAYYVEVEFDDVVREHHQVFEADETGTDVVHCHLETFGS